MTNPKTPSSPIERKDSWKGELQLKPAEKAKPLDDHEIAWVEAYVGNGGDIKAADKAAGFDQGKGKAMLKDPRVREAIELKRDTDIKTLGATQAWSTIQSLMTDPAAPAQTKFQAAKWVLEASGHGLSAVAASLQLGLQKSKKPLSEMSVSELEEFIARGRGTFDHLKSTVGAVIESHKKTIDITPPKDGQA